MKFLLIGAGAREHAIAWKLSNSEVVDKLFVWPGNPAMLGVADLVDLPINSDLAALAAFVRDKAIDAVVVGPETPLAQGISDIMSEIGVPCFGPKKVVAQLESSKAFAKDMMASCKIPTARFKLARSKSECADLAFKQLKSEGAVVLKASGLASGKGVFVCSNTSEIETALERLYGDQIAKASETVVVEERLVGRECSYFAFIGCGRTTSLGFAVDSKRLMDGDKGPNTGGMGCYTPVPWLPSDAANIVHQKIIDPLLRGLKEKNLEYCGCLYVGLMWIKSGPKVVEFNVRLGDPETQVVAVCDKNDWGALLAQALGLDVKLAPQKKKTTTSPFGVGVVIASSGYPYGEIENPREVELPVGLFKEEDPRTIIFGSAVREKAGETRYLYSGKGRVITVVGRGASLKQARDYAYNRVDKIISKWPECKYRRDIAEKVIKEG